MFSLANDKKANFKMHFFGDKDLNNIIPNVGKDEIILARLYNAKKTI